MITRESLARFGGDSTARVESGSRVDFDMAGYLAKQGFAVVRRKPWSSHKGGSVYELANCPFNPEHARGSAAFTLVNGVPGFHCHHDGCRGRNIVDVFKNYPPDSRAGDHSRDPAGRPAEPRAAGHEPSNVGLTANWPQPLAAAAFHGVTGDLVRLIQPQSEADPAALLIQFLVCFGNLIGRQAHFIVEADRHYTNLFAVMVGKTAKGRKGTSLGQIQKVLAVIDPVWSETRNMGGLASGEGMIWAVRDEIRQVSGVRKKGIAEYKELVSDAGEKDKRLMVVEPEFARVLQAAERQSNTLSAVIRQAWDNGNLRILTKNQAARASEAHISIIGHITKDELRKLLSSTAAGNGFANRFLWVCTQRSKLLPEGGDLHKVSFAPIISQVQSAADFARTVEPIWRDDQARAVWGQVYPALSEGQPGLLGAVTSRSESQVMRLACVYALLDCSQEIRSEHLNAALAVWQYCMDSARFIFGDSLGDAAADAILGELRARPQGMTRTEIREYFKRNKSSTEIERALGTLQEHGLARMAREREQEGQIKPTERWLAVRG